MKKVRFSTIIALVAVIGFFLTGCPPGPEPDPTHVHEWGEWTQTKAPTCTTAGVEMRVCSLNSQHTETRAGAAIDPNAHEWGNWTQTKAATATEDGEQTRACTLNAAHTDTQPIIALNHVHDWGNWTVTTHATCTAPGVETRTCTLNANHTETQAIAIDPNAHSWGAWVITTAATETQDGEETRTCAYNPNHIDTNALAALNHTHNWGAWEITTPPTCTEKGEKERVCESNSNHKDYDDIDPTGHDQGEWYTTLPATCVATGTKQLRCTIDNAVLEIESIAIDPNAHNYNYVQTTAPTCSAKGIDTGTCTHNATHTTTREGAAIDPNAHDYGNWTQTIAPTETTDGEETRTCSHNNSHTETRTIPQIPITNTTDFTTILTSLPTNAANTPYTIVLNISDLTDVASAITDSGKYVSLDLSDSTFTSIGDAAFANCREFLTGITIPNTVKSIGWAAFNSCTRLTSIIIPDSVTSIAIAAFDGCNGLISINIPSSVTSIGSSAFRCSSLTTIDVANDNAQYSSENGILYNKNKTSLIQCPGGKTGIVTIPSSVTSIGNSAFDSCTSLTSIIIPDSVTNIRIGTGYAFSYCENLISINVSSSNITYSSEDGVLYNKDKTILYQYPPGKTGNFSMPDSVTQIYNSSFLSCTKLTGITIPNSVTNIGQQAFRECSSLTSITIPSSVTSIVSTAFSVCYNLASVTFEGTVSDLQDYAFQGDLISVYSGPGTYTTSEPGYYATWTKQQ